VAQSKSEDVKMDRKAKQRLFRRDAETSTRDGRATRTKTAA